MAQVEAVTASTVRSVDSSAGSKRRSSLIWMAIACVLLLGSGLSRIWQNQRHQIESDYSENCPFPLKSIPKRLGGWTQAGGGDRTLDDKTMRITGSTEHLMRTYSDELTGVSLVVLVLFGPAEPVVPHTPEVCYPACGFTPAGEANDRVIKSPDGLSSRFRSAVYSRANGRGILREEVYHSFRLEGQWSPDAGNGRKFPRKNPSVFKVQVQRRVAEGERRDQDDPIAKFLELLIPAIEKGIVSGEKPTPAASMDGLRPSSTPDPRVPGGSSSPILLVAADPVLDRGPDDSTNLKDPANQEDQNQDGRQVDQEGPLNGGPDQIVTLDRRDRGTGIGSNRRQTVRGITHRRHSPTDGNRESDPDQSTRSTANHADEMADSETGPRVLISGSRGSCLRRVNVFHYI